MLRFSCQKAKNSAANWSQGNYFHVPVELGARPLLNASACPFRHAEVIPVPLGVDGEAGQDPIWVGGPVAHSTQVYLCSQK